MQISCDDDGYDGDGDDVSGKHVAYGIRLI